MSATETPTPPLQTNPATEPDDELIAYHPEATPTTVAGARPWIPVLFVLSGAAGLLYEVLWSKYLGFVLGNAAVASAIVLATFLGGLALGSALLGRFSDKVPNQLTLYAYLELAIALVAGLTPTLFARLELLVGGSALGLKALACALVLLPPTILMGGTLPALSRFLTVEVGSVQSQVARLYFLNSTGAVVGGMLAGFYLVPRFGLDSSVYLGAFANVAIAIVALHLSKQGLIPIDELKPPDSLPVAPEAGASAVAPPNTQSEALASATIPAPMPPDEPLAPVERRVFTYVLLAVLVSGFAALAYEVAWIRLLALVLGSSTYSFTLMLAAFVAGIAIGAYLVERGLAFGKTPLGRFAWAEVGVAVGVLATLPLYERLPYWFLGFKAMLAPTAAAFPLYEAGKLGFCFVLMLIPTVFLGMTLPLATRLVTTARSEVGTRVGQIFAANTFGNVLGALAATLWLLPWLGIKGVIDLGVLLNLLIAAGAGFLLPGWPPIRRAIVVVVPVLLFVGQRLIAPGFNMQVLSSGVFREDGKDLPATWRDFQARYADRAIKFNRDDANTTVTVAEKDGNIFLSLNGKVDASTEGDLGTQLLSGQLPMLLRPQSKSMLVIGFGSGITAGSALTHPLERLDMAEISPAVMEAGRFFAPYNHDVQQDRRFHAHLEDGLTLLRQPGPTYDVIVTEPSNSWMAGVGNLFTLDAYDLMAARLAPDGLVLQWLPLYETDDETLALIVRSFREVFPYATLWQTEALDTVIIGSRLPIKPDFNALAERVATPKVKAELKRAGLDRVASLLMMQIGTRRTLEDIVPDGGYNRLRYPRLEYAAPVAFFTNAVAQSPYRVDARLGTGGARDADLLLNRWVASGHALTADDYAAYATYQAENLPLNALRGVDARLLRGWREAFPLDDRARIAEAQRLAKRSEVDAALAVLAPIRAKHAAEPTMIDFVSKLTYASVMQANGTWSKGAAGVTEAIAAQQARLKLQTINPAEVWVRLAALYHLAGDRPNEYAAADKALALLDAGTSFDPTRSTDELKQGLCVSVGNSAMDAGDLERAKGYINTAFEIDSRHMGVRYAMARWERLSLERKGNP